MLLLAVLENTQQQQNMRAFDDLCISQLIDIFILFDIFVSLLCPVLFQLDCAQATSFHHIFISDLTP